ncbi:MAG TPA: hypothetical protein VJN70_19080 [Gemmatimonadaceae bacterium]|nr:hypothetical protein [Gemmatimonadaceae bacterium]
MDIQLQFKFSDEGLGSALVAAGAYTVIRVFSKILTALAPTSAILGLLGALMWLGAALYLFVVITWQRDDNWLAAGILMGVSLLVGALVADFISGVVDTSSVTGAVLATTSASVGLVLRTLIIVPLSGGLTAGARWLTSELERNGVISP